MKLQNFEIKNNKIKEKFIELKSSNPKLFKNRLKMSWSNWGFGLESLKDSLKRLSRSGIKFIETVRRLALLLAMAHLPGEKMQQKQYL